MALRIIFRSSLIAAIFFTAGCAGTTVVLPPDALLSEKPDLGLSDSDLSEVEGNELTEQASFDGELKGRLALARLHERRGQMKQAEDLYYSLIKENKRHPLPYHRLGVMAAKRGKYADADKLFQRARQLGPPNAELLSDVGYALYLQNRLEEAEDVLRKALQLEPDHAGAGTNLGLVVGVQGRYRESLVMFKRSTDEAEAYANLAYVHAQRGDLEGALAGYLHALTLNKDLRSAGKALLQLSERSRWHQIAAARQASAYENVSTESTPNGVTTEMSRDLSVSHPISANVSSASRPNNMPAHIANNDPARPKQVETVAYAGPETRETQQRLPPLSNHSDKTLVPLSPPSPYAIAGDRALVRPDSRMSSPVPSDKAPIRHTPFPSSQKLRRFVEILDVTNGSSPAKTAGDALHRGSDLRSSTPSSTPRLQEPSPRVVSAASPSNTSSSYSTGDRYRTAQPTWTSGK